MNNRTDLLNHLVQKHQLKRYLEIGVQNPAQNFDKINCEYKVGVDPDLNADAIFRMDSDSFFRLIHSCVGEFIGTPKTGLDSIPTKYDLVFIDGLHTAEQVQKDFENALKILSPNGFIVLHDCNPQKEEHTIVPRPTARGHWNGDVWRYAVHFHGYDMTHYTVDTDNGCMVIRPDGGLFKTAISQMPWKEFDANRKKYLNLISWEEFVSL